MNLFKRIFSNKEGGIHVHDLAVIPLNLMKEKGSPFNDWVPPDIEVPDEMMQMCNYYTWLYQLFVYYAVANEVLGYDIAEKIIEIQDESANDILDSNLFKIKNSVKKINSAVCKFNESPEISEEDQEEMPLEFSMAKEFFLSGDYDPFNYKDQGLVSEHFAVLGLCLVQGKDSALKVFKPQLQQIAESISA